MNHARLIRGGTWLITGTALLYLAAFASRFAPERLYADSAYYLFWTVNDAGFHIEHGRWVLALAEWPALLGALFGIGMPKLIVAHSLSNITFLGATVCFALFVLKDSRTALALVAAQFIGLTHGLFCPVFELYYGVGLIIMLHAIIINEHLNGLIKLGLTLVLFVLALSSHPMAWVLLLGALALLDPRDRRPLMIPMLLMVIAFALFRWCGMSAYEGAQLGFAKRLFSFAPLRLFQPSTLLAHWRHVVQHYPDVLALTLLSGIILMKERKRRLFLLFVAGLLMLYVLTQLYLPDAPHDRYREQVEFGFTAWVLLSLLGKAWSLDHWRPAILILLAACLGYRITEAERIAPYYTKRTDWLERLVEETRNAQLGKAIIDPRGISFGTVEDRVAPYWSPGIETLLLSAREGPERAVSVITTDDLECPGVPENLDQVVLRCWDVIGPERMNIRYFKLPASRYERIDAPQ